MRCNDCLIVLYTIKLGHRGVGLVIMRVVNHDERVTCLWPENHLVNVPLYAFPLNYRGNPFEGRQGSQ